LKSIHLWLGYRGRGMASIIFWTAGP